MDRKGSIKKRLREFKTEINKDFPVYKIIFFGSRVHGKPHKDSDLIIVSKKFKKLNFIKRAAAMYDYWDLDYPVDFLCYTPEEFKKLSKQITIVREALKEGVVI
jgi:predicted nucleotidyltransferase